MPDIQQKLRQLPAIEKLIQAAEDQPDFQDTDRKLIGQAIKLTVQKAREQVRQGEEIDISAEVLLSRAKQEYDNMLTANLRRVINATGVILHTNLGRAPLSRRAQARVQNVMAGYSTLEYNLESGERGSRYTHVAGLLRQLTGAEDVLVVNNNAAAVVLAVSALAQGREVIVSRGELVEIGGSFRIPDVIRQSGARLVEVGTTNKTHLADYRRAITGETAALLKVHTSNYRIVGFSSQPEPEELIILGSESGLPVIEDLGSGTLLPIMMDGWREPSVAGRIAAGFSVVTFSGDKLFGAGQAGIIAGRKAYIEKMRYHPLLRAFRIDKLSLAALEGTLMDYAYGDPKSDIPVCRMLNASVDYLKIQAENLHAAIMAQVPGCEANVISTFAPAGGGALPAVELEGFGVAVAFPSLSASSAEKQLRQRELPIICRVQDGRILFDLRCLEDADIDEIAYACAQLERRSQ
jgi:L-seryl-tRNA(Ser) seleniumtransferase